MRREIQVLVGMSCFAMFALTVMFPDLSTVLRVPRNAMVWWF